MSDKSQNRMLDPAIETDVPIESLPHLSKGTVFLTKNGQQFSTPELPSRFSTFHQPLFSNVAPLLGATLRERNKLIYGVLSGTE